MKRKYLFRAGAIVLLIALCIWMFIIGRLHTVYFDNKTIEVDGKELPSYEKVVVTVDGEKVANLKKRERGMSTTTGQTFSMVLDVTEEEGSPAKRMQVTLPLPYSMDGIIINIPALLAGASSDVYMEEFVPAPETYTAEDEEIVTDEFAMPSGDE